MIKDHLDASTAAIQSLGGMENGIRRAAEVIAAALRGGGKVMSCGNGGSAAESAHFATELLCRLEKDRPSLAAVNLSADGSFLTATANDYQFDQVFARQVEGLGRKGDVLLAITTSGHSPNILAALEAARARGMVSVGLLGRDGGKAKSLCTVPLVVPSQHTMHIQEAHLVLVHLLCGLIERDLFPHMN